MNFLLDTHVLVWLMTGDKRLRPAWRDALANPDNRIFVSAVVAWEYSELRNRGRFDVMQTIDNLVEIYGLKVLDFPAVAWSVAEHLPDIHRDPVDRMLVAHAQVLDMVLISADEAVRRYPVRSLW